MSDRVVSNQALLDFSNRKLLSPVPKKLYESAKAYFSKKDLDLLQTAYNVAFEAHKDQFRKEGSAYITHPVEVASILIELHLDIETVCAGLMHDVLEDSFIKKSYLQKLFGKDIVEIVDGVSNLNKLDFNSIEDRNANNLQKMALAMSKDIRVIIVKLCDRLHNMRTIEFLPREKQIRKSIETLELYGPIAIRIGMQNIRIELEDLAFKCIHPMRARMLESAVKQTVGGRKRIIAKLRKQFKYHLKNNDITATVKGRQKSLSSIYSKIKNKKKPFSEILDVYAFRVIVNSVDDVYRALGVIHNVHKPIGNRFKDYIAIPKTNGYQALHTSLIALDGVPIEVQIQTKSMEIIAQNGISAHWSYKTKDTVSSDLIGAKKWIESFTALSEASQDSHEFVESIKTDLIYDEVYVFTPAGRIVNLKSGSTPIDFAYELHTDLGSKALACKVNRKFAPLNIRLENGQSIEIITSDKPEVSPDWLNFVVTSKARSSIRLALRQQKISQARKAGKLMLESELKRGGVTLDQYRGSTMSRILEMIGVKSLNELLTDLGSGNKTGALVAERFFSGLNIKKSKNSKLKAMVLSDHQIEGVSVIYAKCCMPIHGDPITAHSDTDRGIVIHHARCRQVAPHRSHNVPSRYFPAMWGSNTRELHYKGHVKIHAEDRPGILADIASVFTKSNLNIVNIQSRDIDAMIIEFVIEVEVLNADSINKLMLKLRSLRYVTSCSRIVNDAKTKNEKTNFYK
ncbi:MAG: bifunctional (p)ppGpp synthetase/guanosine-3',5'-bis(diphosphate) 3'-pyrophosphohydrolase [SAR86 cluster bacterium]|nr:bifunctional (p)ppGpp synthetase/guanosine-3',5'-bis(diphosphate) 3'-pyrophosphohydrolase [SAR86 cluster bacterium]MDA8798774.1 bifunctional (p)ppGpp synthetase/guanosine-3',5'-bis(diphosphate) 3'-pyrophosphohydrolase [Gammaproteobacteria bacterium]MDA9140617.1 bifunctional (p)ppGpp synthetase/guanosine-3',5'-bis(diphosphate) 3'-pyrophosphohydrolase [Gammaproteobacteria bacterium]MDC0905779.1 bifunctional (p)ppGpp synthetase/guanosine-3',5'-bis(diphosphate) 3'-pyrophosphohydrolase [Gammaprote